MKDKTKRLMICILIPLAVGALAAFLTRGSMQTFGEMVKPPLSPPGWLFPVVWTVLYVLMGYASFRIYRMGIRKPGVREALLTYGVQLFFNFFWPIFFFRLSWYWFSFIWLIVLWIFILLMIQQYYKLDRTAAYLMIPYLIWCTFAAYLNVGIAILN